MISLTPTPTPTSLDPQAFFLINAPLHEVSICKANSGISIPITPKSYRELLDVLFYKQLPPSNKIQQLLEYLTDIKILTLTNNPISNSQFKITKTSIERLFVEITSKCNLACRHCYGDFRPSKLNQLPLSDFENIAHQAADCGIYRVDLTGGEPLMHPQIASMIECLEQTNLLYTIFSNLTFMNDTISKAINDYRPEYVITSIESSVAETHDAFRMGRHAYQKTIDNIKRLIKFGIKVKVNVVLGAHNIDDFDKTVDTLLDLGVSEIIVDAIRLEGRATNNLLADKQKLYAATHKITNTAYPFGTTYPCGISTKMIYLASDSRLYLCPSLKQPKFQLGDINDESFSLYDAIKSLPEKFPEFNQSSCRISCPAGAYCAGGCPASNYNSGLKVSGPDQSFCDRFLK